MITLSLQPDGRVTVDMGAPRLAPTDLPFDVTGLTPREVNGCALWPLALADGVSVEVALVSMGNPHAVQLVSDADAAPVALIGPQVEAHAPLPAQGQCRLHAGAQPQPHQAACV